jgi:hypothetical protein
MVGVTGFEPATPASRTQCSSQAELHPVVIIDGHWPSGFELRDLYTIASFPRRVIISRAGQSVEIASRDETEILVDDRLVSLFGSGRRAAARGFKPMPHLADYLTIILMSENSGPRHEDIRTCLRNRRDIISFDAAVDLQIEVEAAPL